MSIDLRRIDVNLLVTLDALLQTGSVTQAARRLHLSQPAVSSQLRRLRALFDDPLFVPKGRGLAPSPRGAALKAPLRDALARLTASTDAGLRFDPDTSTRTFRVVATDALHASVTIPLLASLRTEAPGVRLALLPLRTETIGGQLSAGQVDLAVLTPSTTPTSVATVPLRQERFASVGRRGHPALAAPVRLDRFCAAEHVLVSLVGGGFVGAIDEALKGLGRQRKVVCSVPSFLLVPELVASSDLVATVPAEVARGWRRRLRVVPTPVPIEPFDICLARSARTRGDPGVDWLEARLREGAAD